jgi:hypothetical protein
MKRTNGVRSLNVIIVLFAVSLVPSLAQGDPMDGPAVKLAREALTTQKKETTMQAKIPQSLQAEHAELHQELSEAIKEGGKVGEAAKVVAERLHSHFLKEEEYALPQLGLLTSLAQGKLTPDMKSAIAMSDRLKADLPHMLQEHQAIVAALENLIAAANQEGKIKYVHFAEKLKLHAQTEEEFLYPTSILIGEYLKLKLVK